MRRFGSRQPSFSASPLCPSVPLDGSETVLGLRDLDKHHRATKEAEALAERSKQTSSVQQRSRPQSRSQHRRYQGPYIHQLTLQDLRRQPQDWQHFIGMESHSGPCTSWAASFNVPEHVNMLAERLEENLIHFLVSTLSANACHELLSVPEQMADAMRILYRRSLYSRSRRNGLGLRLSSGFHVTSVDMPHVRYDLHPKQCSSSCFIFSCEASGTHAGL